MNLITRHFPLFLLIIAPFSAHAALGEKATSVSADAHALVTASGTAVVRTESRPETDGRFAVKVIGDPGCTVKEFIGPSGVVFAVAWTGLHHPDLTSLLGPYAAEYHGAARKYRHEGHSPISVRSANTVVELGGQMRSVMGRAYVSSLMPSDVSLDEVHF